MSVIAAKIFGKRQAAKGSRLLQDVSERHRLSYCDLDRMLDHEEHELAKDKQLELASTKHASTTTDDQKKDGIRSKAPKVSGQGAAIWTPFDGESLPASDSSGSDASEDEIDAEFAGKHEEELLLELDESNQDDIHSVNDAEDHLVRDLSTILHDDITKEQLARMSRLLEINCLHRGNFEVVKGKRWMVAFDGSLASQRAWEGVLGLMQPEDHLFVITVRDKNLPRRFALYPSEELQLQFELWRSARHILKPCLQQLSQRLKPEQYTVATPSAWDARRTLCSLAQQYKIDVLCVGRHSKREHNRHHWHLRSLHRYATKHAHCQVIVF